MGKQNHTLAPPTSHSEKKCWCVTIFLDLWVKKEDMPLLGWVVPLFLLYIHVLICRSLENAMTSMFVFRYLYWADWGKPGGKIEKAGMDGKGRVTVVSQNLTWPNGLAIDYDRNRLYWTDAGLNVIESSTLEGHDRKVRLLNVFPYSGLSMIKKPC